MFWEGTETQSREPPCSAGSPFKCTTIKIKPGDGSVPRLHGPRHAHAVATVSVGPGGSGPCAASRTVPRPCAAAVRSGAGQALGAQNRARAARGDAGCADGRVSRHGRSDPRWARIHLPKARKVLGHVTPVPQPKGLARGHLAHHGHARVSLLPPRLPRGTACSGGADGRAREPEVLSPLVPCATFSCPLPAWGALLYGLLSPATVPGHARSAGVPAPPSSPRILQRTAKGAPWAQATELGPGRATERSRTQCPQGGESPVDAEAREGGLKQATPTPPGRREEPGRGQAERGRGRGQVPDTLLLDPKPALHSCSSSSQASTQAKHKTSFRKGRAGPAPSPAGPAPSPAGPAPSPAGPAPKRGWGGAPSSGACCHGKPSCPHAPGAGALVAVCVLLATVPIATACVWPPLLPGAPPSAQSGGQSGGLEYWSGDWVASLHFSGGCARQWDVCLRDRGRETRHPRLRGGRRHGVTTGASGASLSTVWSQSRAESCLAVGGWPEPLSWGWDSGAIWGWGGSSCPAALGGAPRARPRPSCGLPRSSEPGALGSYRWPRGQEPHRGGQPPSPQAAWLCLQPTESGKAWRKMPDTQRHRLNRACGRVAAVQGPERGQGGSSAVTGGPAPGPWGGDREGALCSSGTRASRL